MELYDKTRDNRTLDEPEVFVFHTQDPGVCCQEKVL